MKVITETCHDMALHMISNEGYSRNVSLALHMISNEGYYRNVSLALHMISRLLKVITETCHWHYT